MNEQIEIRKIIDEEITRAKIHNPAYSLRAFAKKLSIQPSALSEILNGKREVTRKMAVRILEPLFINPKKIRDLTAGLQNKKSPQLKATTSQEFTQVNMDHYHVISEWYYFAILSLAETKDFSDNPIWIARRLNISASEVKTALKRLERLDLLKRENGHLVWAGLHFKTSSDIVNMSLRKSHYQNLELAKSSLATDDLTSRDFSSMTMAIDSSLIPEAKERITKFRRELCAFLENGPNRDQVYHLAVSLYPVTVISDSIGEKNE